MVRTLQLTGFVKPARRGITQPLIVRCRDEAGKDEAVYLKTVAGYANRPQAAGVELFTTLLARQLGLKAPEPVVVEVPQGAERMVSGAPKHAALLRLSAGLNFGTVALGPDWKGWLPDLSTRSFPDAMVEKILAFDGLVQHTDRGRDNPNLMWNANEIAVLDHEKVFTYLGIKGAGKRPWRAFFQMAPFARHVLQPAAKHLMGPDFGKVLWEDLLSLELGGGINECRLAAEANFPTAKVDLLRIQAYLSALAADAGDFFEFLSASLQR
jgi:hypothetical protein